MTTVAPSNQESRYDRFFSWAQRAVMAEVSGPPLFFQTTASPIPPTPRDAYIPVRSPLLMDSLATSEGNNYRAWRNYVDDLERDDRYRVDVEREVTAHDISNQWRGNAMPVTGQDSYRAIRSELYPGSPSYNHDQGLGDYLRVYDVQQSNLDRLRDRITGTEVGTERDNLDRALRKARAKGVDIRPADVNVRRPTRPPAPPLHNDL